MLGRSGSDRSFPAQYNSLAGATAVARGVGTGAARTVARRIGIVTRTVARGVGAFITSHYSISEIVGKDFEALSVVELLLGYFQVHFFYKAFDVFSHD